MRARASLLFLVALLVVGLAALAPPARPPAGRVPPPEPVEQLLQGTWVAVRVDQGWVATDQIESPGLYDVVDLRRPPEEWAVPADPHADAMTVTFTGSRYVTRRGEWVEGYGEFAVDHRANPPVLRTKGYRITRHIHPGSMSVFTHAAPAEQARVSVGPGRLRMCVSLHSGELRDDLRAVSDESYVVTFARL